MRLASSKARDIGPPDSNLTVINANNARIVGRTNDGVPSYASFRFYSCFPDHLAPFGNFGFDVIAELFRRAADRLRAVGRQLVLYIWTVQYADDFGVEFIDDGPRCLCRRKHAVPSRDFIAGNTGFLHRRQ